MHKQLPTWLESSRHLCHKKLVVFHVFKELPSSAGIHWWNQVTYLNWNYSIKTFGFEFVVYHIPSDDFQVIKPLLLGLGINIYLLCFRVRERCDFRIGQDFSEIQCSGSPSTSSLKLVASPLSQIENSEVVKTSKHTQDQEHSYRPSTPPSQYKSPT